MTGAKGCWMFARTGRAVCIPTEDRGNEKGDKATERTENTEPQRITKRRHCEPRAGGARQSRSQVGRASCPPWRVFVPFVLFVVKDYAARRGGP